jgi:predicted aspartyl protease
MLAPAMDQLNRLLALALGVAWLAAAGPAAADCTPAPDYVALTSASPEDAIVGPTRSDSIGRVVAPISVNGQGPFRFIVDTGANRSVLSDTLAQRLGLTPNGTGAVHSVHGVTQAPLVQVSSLGYGRLSLGSAEVPMLHGAVLAGEQGLLGVDGMRGRRLRMDFVRDCIEIIPSHDAPRLRRGWVTLRGELRFGHLVVIPGKIGEVDVNLFVDTGSNSTLANPALRDALAARLRRPTNVRERTIAYTAGRPVVLDNAVLLPRVRLGPAGEVQLRNITAYVGNFHIFQLWGLTDEPAMLVGMDVLSQAREIAIDYERATVHVRFAADDRVSVVFVR